jgi:hypothetical protein
VTRNLATRQFFRIYIFCAGGDECDGGKFGFDFVYNLAVLDVRDMCKGLEWGLQKTSMVMFPRIISYYVT